VHNQTCEVHGIRTSHECLDPQASIRETSGGERSAEIDDRLSGSLRRLLKRVNYGIAVCARRSWMMSTKAGQPPAWPFLAMQLLSLSGCACRVQAVLG
jgi:hypothetical protein